MGSTVFRIPSDVIKPSGYRPRVLYTSSGILNTVDPLASASNLYVQENKNIKNVKRCRDGMPKSMQTRQG